MTKVLLIGNIFDDKWIGSFVRSIKKCDPTLQIDILNTNTTEDFQLPTFVELCSNIILCKRNFLHLGYKIPRIRGLLMQLDIYIEIHRLTKRMSLRDDKYDLINIHYLQAIFYYCADKLLRISNNILLSPWGSDILRVKKRQLKKLSALASKVRYISCGRSEQGRFRQDIIRLLNVPEEKLINIGFGTEMIDSLNHHTGLTREEAKNHLNLKDRYVIVCGYNAHRAQNHIKIIESIASKKEALPDNLVLLLPMTYGIDLKYIECVEKRAKESGLSYKILSNYLSNEELIYVRKCADMFIHAQDTDANSGSLAEYLLCKAKVINASWLIYPHREKYGRPYYVFDSFDNLGEVIVQAYKSDVCLVSDLLIQDILKDGWSQVGNQWATFYNACAK